MLQNSYLAAVAAAAGCTMAKPEPDDGTDYVLTHRSDEHTVDVEVDLKIQLKSTIVSKPNPASGFVSVPLSNKRFEMMALTPVTTKRIVVAMALPDMFEDWIDASHDVFRLRHCAYWVNIAGEKPTGRTKSSVRVPTSQIFDDVALCAIMKRLGQGGVP